MLKLFSYVNPSNEGSFSSGSYYFSILSYCNNQHSHQILLKMMVEK